MARPMQVMWYINPNDGPFPWKNEGKFTPDLMRSRRIAVTLDNRGYYGTLTVGRNPLVETASWIPITEKLRFLIPIYPGVTPPAQLVQQAKLFDSISNGRLLLNQVNGTDEIMTQYGVDVPSDQRYAMSTEYWTVFKKLYAGEIDRHQGKYFHFGPPPFQRAGPASGGIMVQAPHTPVWGSGTAPAGLQHAGEVLDVYLAHLFRPDRLLPQIKQVRSVASKLGRGPVGAGVLVNVIVRKTDAEAWAHAQWLLEQTGPERIVQQIEERMRTGRYNNATGSREAATLASLTSEDPMIKSRLDALKAGKLPDVRSLESYPNLWSGPNIWGALDVLDQGWGGYLVGSAQSVAERMRDLQKMLGMDAFILAGWPTEEEAVRCADLLLPLLDLDRTPPQLRPA